MPEPFAVRAPGTIWLVAIAAALAGAVLPTPWWQLGIIAVAVLACAVAGRLRAPALRFGLIAAALFVCLRLVYRFVFAPALSLPSDATLIIDMPSVPLGGPFQGVSLLGPLSLEQVLATLADASRFAVVFVAFGAANALADARTMLGRAPRPLQPVATVLALALGTLPALLASVRQVSRAARMRGEKRGPRLLVPVLEQAVERSTTLGASMELRGERPRRERTGRRDEASPHGDGTAELLRVAGAGVAFRGGEAVLAGVDLALRAGEVTVLTGPTGSGKSTLLALLAGLAPAYTGGEASGTLLRAGRVVTDARPSRFAGWVALVPQRVEHSFLADTVRRELEFAPARRGLEGGRLTEVVDAALERFDLQDLAHREPTTLSAGEATRVAIAAACLAEPRVLLLDEPVADLDPDSTRAVLDAVRDLVAEGCAVLIAEHRPEALQSLQAGAAVRWIRMEQGALALGEPVSQAAPRREPARATAHTVRPAAGPDAGPDAAAPAIVLAQNLEIVRAGRTLLHVGDLSVAPGTITVIAGPNGSGKTSLLEDIALPGSSGRAAGIALVPHRVDDLLIRDTLAAEYRFADARARAQAGATARRFAQLLGGSMNAEHFERLRSTHPRDLSAGTRLVLGIAVQLAHEPRVVLLDEPTRGLDASARDRLAGLLTTLAEQGTATVITTHDARFADSLAGVPVRRLRVEAGSLVESSALARGGAA